MSELIIITIASYILSYSWLYDLYKQSKCRVTARTSAVNLSKCVAKCLHESNAPPCNNIVLVSLNEMSLMDKIANHAYGFNVDQIAKFMMKRCKTHLLYSTKIQVWKNFAKSFIAN